MPGARCTRGLAYEKQEEHERSHYRFTRFIRHSLRNGFNGVLGALLGEPGSFATVLDPVANDPYRPWQAVERRDTARFLRSLALFGFGLPSRIVGRRTRGCPGAYDRDPMLRTLAPGMSPVSEVDPRDYRDKWSILVEHWRCMALSLLALPPITTERLHLRALRPFDAGAFRQMTDEPAITNAIDFLPAPFTLLDAQKLINGDGEGRDCFWGVWLRENALLVGTVGTHLRSSHELEIGYWFSSFVRGQGIGTEAAEAVVRSISVAFPSRYIVAECRPENQASWRLLEKVGFRADGTDGARSGRKRLVFIKA